MSCRQLSPLLAASLPFLLFVAVLPANVAAATVQGITVETDRMDYVNVPGFNRVTATANISFNGNFGTMDAVLFSWFEPGNAVPMFNRTVAPTQISAGLAQAVDRWTADREGIGFTVLASINETQGTPPVLADFTTFNVYNRSTAVIVTDIVVTTSQPVYENSTVAIARAELTYAGNATFLADVSFEWFYPAWTLARTEQSTVTPIDADTAESWSTWTTDRDDAAPFHVNATYLGGGSVSNTTSFNVVPPQVTRWLTGPLPPGRVTLANNERWGVCENLTVPTGTELFVEPGTIVRFCPRTGLFVNGTLTVDALTTSRVLFLPLGFDMRAGDWQGITFFPAASGSSILSNAVIQAVTVGIRVEGVSITIANTTVAAALGPAIWLINSASVVGSNTITECNVGVRIESTPTLLLDGNRISRCRTGVLAIDSDLLFAANDVFQNEVIGLQAVRTPLTVEGGTFRDNGVGIYLSEVPEATIGAVAITGGNDSLQAVDSQNLHIVLSTLAGARFRGVYLMSTTATVTNSTLAAQTWDIVQVAAPTVFVNTTYSKVFTPVGSTLTVRYFLHILVVTEAGDRFAGASVNVSSDGNVVASRASDANGWSQWILLTYAEISSTTTRLIPNRVEAATAGYAFPSNPRDIDMSSSHVERFLAVPTTPDNSFRLPVDALVLLAVAVFLGSVLLLMPAMRRRRNGKNGRRVLPTRNVALEPGTGYVLPDEKPDRAFAVLAEQIAHGAKGLVVSRIYPDEVRRRYRLRDLPVLWLSRGYGKETVNPTNLGALLQEIERFASGKENSVVLLDGLEYLLVQNDAQKVVKFVQSLADSASVHHAKVLIPFNTKSVSEAQAALLTRDLVTL